MATIHRAWLQALGVVVLLVLVVGCRSATPAVTSAPLVGTSWIAQDLDATLTFEDDGRASGQAACNRYVGTFEQTDDALRLKLAGTTRMACPPAVMEQEGRFLGALSAVTAFRREGSTLLLLDEHRRARVRLAPLAPGPAAGAAAGVLRAHAFDCAGGPSIILAQAQSADSSEVIDLVLPGGRRRLPRVPTASGARYMDGGISVWNKDREATLEMDGRTYACVENRRRSILEDARIRGVEFRAAGQEPGWILELLPDRMAFLGGPGTRPVTTPRPSPRPSLAAGETVYAAVTEAHRLTVRIRETQCADSMSGERYEASVEVELDGKVYRGCGEALC